MAKRFRWIAFGKLDLNANSGENYNMYDGTGIQQEQLLSHRMWKISKLVIVMWNKCWAKDSIIACYNTHMIWYKELK